MLSGRDTRLVTGAAAWLALAIAFGPTAFGQQPEEEEPMPKGCTITGTDGDDSGADALEGTEGADIICGLAGNDELIGLEGDDLLNGGSGDDLLDCGDGLDIVDYSLAGPGGMIVKLAKDLAEGQGSDTVMGCESVIGSDSNDTLWGNAKDNAILGEKGRDVIRARGGDDDIFGGRGKDQLFGGRGEDELAGGPGGDRLDGGGNKDRCHGGKLDDVRRCER
ncbi:MAG: calcium-binding protein [Actinomycetota bacterium]